MTDQATTQFHHNIIKARLNKLGLKLPEAPHNAATYIPAIRSGNIVYTSGQLPLKDGAMASTGKVGSHVTTEEATEMARICVLNALAAAGGVGDLDRARILKVTGFVASSPGFNAQPAVINGASELLLKLFGANGEHARSAVGVAELPLDAPVEVEILLELT
ncbi:RidA family protein [Arthrobacter sp. Soil764]|uniref:RidA family protein n=1 Tax=Arthrobacter sp. Soil764 TaxID=1736403 RepID=UPI0006FDB00C|nr:RidA family protein [Arthrobacter sp. Soil764]KRE81443.1 LysR family transcriptional regulator [Arthrobacter sp. Soil764]